MEAGALELGPFVGLDETQVRGKARCDRSWSIDGPVLVWWVHGIFLLPGRLPLNSFSAAERWRRAIAARIQRRRGVGAYGSLLCT